jgi:hypothetical protein
VPDYFLGYTGVEISRSGKVYLNFLGLTNYFPEIIQTYISEGIVIECLCPFVRSFCGYCCILFPIEMFVFLQPIHGYFHKFWLPMLYHFYALKI